MRNWSRVKEFSKNEDGSMTIFSLFLFTMMILVGGIGVDLMRNEMERTRQQAALDGAVLAAANLQVDATPQEIFTNFMTASGYPVDSAGLSVVNEVGLRRVSYVNRDTTPTQIMNFLGRDTLPVVTASTAIHQVNALEVSLVLDVSTSMLSDNRLTSMIPAAKKFVDIVLDDELEDVTTVNLVPYGGDVNVGDVMFERLGGVRQNTMADVTEEYLEYLDTIVVPANGRSCLDLNVSDLSSTALPSAGIYAQIPHYGVWTTPNSGSNGRQGSWCPSEESRVVYGSNNKTALYEAIDDFSVHDGTGTQWAMKYAVALLDPSSRNDFAALKAAGELGSDYTDRPHAWTDARKYLVLMSDGGTSFEYRPRDAFDLDNVDIRLNNNVSNRQTTRERSSARNDFAAFCALAKAQHPELIIYTVAMDSAVAANYLEDCASSPSHFFTVSDDTINAAFQTIGQNLARDALRLTN